MPRTGHRRAGLLDPEHALPLGTPEEVGEYVVRMQSIRPDATTEVLAAHGRYVAPRHGQYALVTFDVTYVGKGTGAPRYDLGVNFQGGDGIRYPTCAGGLAASSAPALATGQAASMTICLDLNASAVPMGTIMIQAFSAPGQKDKAFWGLS